MSKSEEAFEQKRAEIDETYARTGFARLVDYIRDNPQFRSVADGGTIHLTANRSFSHSQGEEVPSPIMKINLTASFKKAGGEQKAELAIDIAGKSRLSVSSSGFTGTSGEDFKRASAVNNRFNDWLSAIERTIGIDNFSSTLREKAGYSGASHPRAPQVAKYEGQ